MKNQQYVKSHRAAGKWVLKDVNMLCNFHTTVILLREGLMRPDGMKVKIFKRPMLPQ